MLLNVPKNSTAQKLPIGQLPVKGRKLGMQPASFPGATAPGTGARHFPEPQVDRSAAAGLNERREEFETKTAKNYCKDFPGLVRASTPLYIKSAGPQQTVENLKKSKVQIFDTASGHAFHKEWQEPLGKVEQQLEDAGPQTGHRRMPGTVDIEGRMRPRRPSHPEENVEELQRELDIRYKLL